MEFFAPIALLSAFFLGPAQAQSVDDHVNRLLLDRKIPGMVLVIARDGKIIHEKAYGYADVDKGIPMGLDSQFRLYSMSKPVTSIAMLQLMNAGKVSLETELAHILPAFSAHPSINIKQLLTHTAGISYRHSKLLHGSLDKFSAALALQPLEQTPGKSWTYGLSSDLLGAAIEKLSGTTLPEYFRRNIFAPLGMNQTSFSADPAKLVTMYRIDRATGLPVAIDGDKQSIRHHGAPSAGGGLVGTASDYMKLVLAIVSADSRVIPPAFAQQLVSNQLPDGVLVPPKVYPDSGYSLGLGVRLSDGPHLSSGSYYWAGKGGTIFWADPGRKLAVVAMTQVDGIRSDLELQLQQWIDR